MNKLGIFTFTAIFLIPISMSEAAKDFQQKMDSASPIVSSDDEEHHYYEHVVAGEDGECHPLCENGKHGCPACVPHIVTTDPMVTSTKIVFALPKSFVETLTLDPEREFFVSAGPESGAEFTLTLTGRKLALSGGRVVFRYTMEKPMPLALLEIAFSRIQNQFVLKDAKTEETLFSRNGFVHTKLEYKAERKLMKALFELQ